MKYINEKTAPYLKLLTVKTRLSESPIVEEMFRSKEGYCFKIAKADAACNPDTGLIGSDMDRRWPKLAAAFSQKVDMVSGAFFQGVSDFSHAFVVNRKAVNGYLAGKTFSGTVMVDLQRVTMSYSMSFDSNGDPDDICILLISSHGQVLAYISPAVQFVTRMVQDAAVDMYDREIIDLFSRLVGAFVITDIARDYILYCHFAAVKADLVTRCGVDGNTEPTGDPDALVNCFPFDIRRLSGLGGPFVFPGAGKHSAAN